MIFSSVRCLVHCSSDVKRSILELVLLVLLRALALSFTKPRERIQGTHLCDRNIPHHCGYIFLNRSRWNSIARGCLWLIEVLSWLYQSSLIEAGKLSRQQGWICQHWIVMLTSQIWSSYSLVVVCLRNEQESSYPRLSPKRKKEDELRPCRAACADTSKLETPSLVDDHWSGLYL